LSKCVNDLVNFYKKCSFIPAEAPFSLWAERGTKMMSLDVDMKNEEEKTAPEKSAYLKLAVNIFPLNFVDQTTKDKHKRREK
jgi:hypothetical protein